MNDHRDIVTSQRHCPDKEVKVCLGLLQWDAVSALIWDTIASQIKARPIQNGISVRPSGLIPASLLRLLHSWKPARTRP